jgi:hypothetical protein
VERIHTNPLDTTSSPFEPQAGNLKLESITPYLEPQGGEQLQEKVGVNPLYSNIGFGVNLSAYSNHFNDLLQRRGYLIPISKRKTRGYSNDSNLTPTLELTSTERYSNAVSPLYGGPWSSV